MEPKELYRIVTGSVPMTAPAACPGAGGRTLQPIRGLFPGRRLVSPGRYYAEGHIEKSTEQYMPLTARPAE